jgi:lactoylglutathione lyase
MIDTGLSHIALVVRDLDVSIRFYEDYAAMRVIHRRPGKGDISAVAWMSDFTRPFALVLVESTVLKDTALGPFRHIGVACRDKAEIDRLAQKASAAGILRSAPQDSGPPVGYWTTFADPDGNTLELSFGQQIAFTIDDAERLARQSRPEG